MEYLLKERCKHRSLFSKALRDFETNFIPNSDQLFGKLQYRAKQLFDIDERIKEVYLSSPEISQNYLMDTLSTDNYKSDWRRMKIQYYNYKSSRNADRKGGEYNAPFSEDSVTEQCRFCGELSKVCIPAINQSYITDNKTSLTFNDVSVHLDFNNASLPTTVCRDCDARLQEMFDFVKVVKTAQSTLINVAEKREEIKTLLIKTECDEDDESQDHDGNNDDDENKDGIVDSITVGETVYIKESFTHKRKTVHDEIDTPKSKKPKEKEKVACDIMNGIKEEHTEDDTNEVNSASRYTGYLTNLGLGSETGCERQFQSGFSDTGHIDDKPSEVELATSSLVYLYEMANDGTGGFSQ